MSTCKVRITEILQKVVEVEAKSQEDALALVEEKWNASEYVLDAENFMGVNFTIEE